MEEDVFKDRLVQELKEYFPNDNALQNFCRLIVMMRDNPDYALSDVDTSVLRNSIKDLSVFTSLGIYTKVLGKMSSDVKNQLDVTTRRKGVKAQNNVSHNNVTATVYESNRFDLGFKIEPTKVSHVDATPKVNSVKEYSSKSNTFSLEGVDLTSNNAISSDIPTYDTYTSYDTYDDVPTVNVDDLDIKSWDEY